MLKGIGIYTTHSEVIAVSVVRSVSGFQIKNYVIEPIQLEGLPESDGGRSRKSKKITAVSNAIRRALEKIKEPHAYVSAALSPSEAVTRHFIMPTVPKKEEAGAIFFEASRYIPFKLSESVLDYYAKVTHKNVFAVMVTAIRREVLQAYLEDLRDASARVLMIEPVYCAASRAFQTLQGIGKVKAYGLIVLLQDGNVNVTLTANGLVYLSRDFILGGNVAEDKGRFFEEVKASLDYFYKLTGGEAIEQIFLAGFGTLAIWVEHLESSFNYKIRFDVAHFPNEKKISPENQNAILVAYGLALRVFNVHSPLGEIKLLPKEERKSPLLNFMLFLGMKCFLILCIFLFVRFAIFQPYFFQLQKQNDAILGPLMRENPNFIDMTIPEIEVKKEKMQSRVRQLENFIKQRIPFSVLLSTLGQNLPESIAIDYMNFEDSFGGKSAKGNKNRKRMSLKGACYLGSAQRESDTINGWVKSLTEKKAMSDYFSEIKLEEIKRDKFKYHDITRFQIVGE